MSEMRQIPGFPSYSITKTGRVWSNHSRKWLKLGVDKQGRITTWLWREGRQYQQFVHRLLLQTYVGPCPVGMMSMHKDGDETNFRLDNLQWATMVQIAQARIDRGTNYMPDTRGERQGCSKLTEDQVHEIFSMYRTGRYLQRTLAELFGVTQSNISCIVTRKTWQCVSI